MKKFAFRLNRILGVRKLQEDQKLAELGIEQRRLAAEQNKLQLFQTEAESQSNQIRMEQAQPFTIWMKNENTRYLKRIQRVVEFQSQSVAEQKAATESAKDRYLDARRSTQSLEMLHDKQHSEWQIENLRDESNTLDEIGNRRQGGES